MLYFVYCIVFRPDTKVVYIGSTKEIVKRRKNYLEHAIQHKKGTRINIALTHFQPCSKHFSVNVLWKGECSHLEVLAIEQHYMDKFDTLFKGDRKFIHNISVDPLRLNTNRACSNNALLLRAFELVFKHTEGNVMSKTTDIGEPMIPDCQSTIHGANMEEDYARIMSGLKRKRELLDYEHEKKKRSLEWETQLELLDAKYKWANEQGKVQLAEHITTLIADMPLPNM